MNKKPKQYEYTKCTEVQELNELGQKGWKLTTTCLNNQGYTLHYLRKRIK